MKRALLLLPIVAVLGASAGAADPEVTLELRHGGESVNPLRFVG